MSREEREALDALLENVPSSRRSLLKQLLIGGGTLAGLIPLSSVVSAQDDTSAKGKNGKGKDGKGKHGKGKHGKGKAKGKGKGDEGSADEGKGKGKTP
jgi:hypothetical protein